MIDEFVWGIFVVDSTNGFPNFFPIGIYTTRETAIKEFETLPKENNYQLLRMPINNSFAFYHKKSGKLVGMDRIHHEHFYFKEGS